MISLKFVLVALMTAASALGHAEPSTPFANHHKEIARRQLEMNKRHVLARNCAPQVAEYQRRRKVRRALRKRGLPTGPIQLKGNQPQNQGQGQNQGHQNGGQNHGQQGQGPHGHSGVPSGSGAPTGSTAATTSAVATSVETTDDSTTEVTSTDETTESATSISSSDEATSTLVDKETTDSTFTDTTSIYATTTGTAAAAHYSTIKNFTCVMAPEVVEGPYYLRDDYVRQDIREDQAGTPLYLDIGVLDITTCTPVTDAFVEIWSANAQGEYSGFGNAGTTGGGGNGTVPSGSGSPPGGSAPTQSGNDTVIPTGTFSGPAPSGSGGPTGGGGGTSSGKANGDNFLRGGYTVDDNGIVEITTIYPGFYSGRTVHIHTMVHQNLSYHSNGTIISSSGSLRHIGQFFFDEAFNTEVLAQEAYSGSGQSHTYNDEDGILQTANTDGYSAFVEIERLGDTLDEGLLGYITVGIDTSASYTISTSNYWDPDFEPASASST